MLPIDGVPDLLRETVVRWCERFAELPMLVESIGRLPAPLRAELARVIAASDFVAATLIRDAGALAWFAGDGGAGTAAGAEYERRAAACESAEEAQRVLREWRGREMLRIAWRDIVGTASSDETLRALSDFADAAIRAASAAAERQLATRFGRPRTAQGVGAPLGVPVVAPAWCRSSCSAWASSVGGS